MTECVLGATYTAEMQGFERDIANGTLSPVSLSTILVSPKMEETGDSAVLRFHLRFKELPNAPADVENKITLTRQGMDWKIVPPLRGGNRTGRKT